MSIEDYPLRAKDGLTITVSETYIKLYQLMLASRSPDVMRVLMDVAEIPADDRLALIEAIDDRAHMLRSMLRQQVGALATLRRQSS